MPSSIVSNHVSTDNSSDRSRDITMAKPRSQQPAIYSTDSESVTPKVDTPSKTIQKQSWDYVIRSGTAGGLAACAVRMFKIYWQRGVC